MIKNKEGEKAFLYPEFQYLSEKHPDLYEHFTAIAKYPREKCKYLDVKTKLFIPMVILAHRGETEMVCAHIKRAFSMGITEGEILEIFLAALLPGGAPTLLIGMKALLKAKKDG